MATVGIQLGEMLGLVVGNADGIREDAVVFGYKVGGLEIVLGALVGDRVGFFEGKRFVGFAVGLVVGNADGIREDAVVFGYRVGGLEIVLGALVGDRVGFFEGKRVGNFEGSRVGEANACDDLSITLSVEIFASRTGPLDDL